MYNFIFQFWKAFRAVSAREDAVSVNLYTECQDIQEEKQIDNFTQTLFLVAT